MDRMAEALNAAYKLYKRCNATKDYDLYISQCNKIINDYSEYKDLLTAVLCAFMDQIERERT